MYYKISLYVLQEVLYMYKRCHSYIVINRIKKTVASIDNLSHLIHNVPI